jgi:hypothetical protein
MEGGRMGISVETWQAPDSAVRSEEWPKPGPVAIVDGRLVHDYKAWYRKVTFTGVRPGMLEGFLALADAPSDEIAAYVSESGWLDLCQHHLPTSSGTVGHVDPHPWPSLPPYLALTGVKCFAPVGECVIPKERSESVTAWRYWSSQARGLAGVGLALAKRRVARQRDLARLFERAPWCEPPLTTCLLTDDDEGREIIEADRLVRLAGAHTLSTKALRRIVEDGLDFWLTMSRMSVRLHWNRSGPDTYYTGGLFAALGVQLMNAITGRQGFAICSGCGRDHVPARPNDTRASFCLNCRLGKASQRQAAERYEGKRLAKRRAERNAK